MKHETILMPIPPVLLMMAASGRGRPSRRMMMTARVPGAKKYADNPEVRLLLR